MENLDRSDAEYCKDILDNIEPCMFCGESPDYVDIYEPDFGYCICCHSKSCELTEGPPAHDLVHAVWAWNKTLKTALPCPYCESTDLEIKYDNSMPDEILIQVVCKSCFTNGPISSTAQKAIKKWNQRIPDPGKDCD